MDIVYRADVKHEDWGGSVTANDRWRERLYGWERSYDGGKTWCLSVFRWDDEVVSGALVPVKGDASHTDADLAMALGLAKLIAADVYSDLDLSHPDNVSDWLYDEVVNELLARGGAQ